MPSQTEHTVATGPGSKFRASVSHTSSRAYQMDFYIPKSIWKVPVVEKFFDALAQLGGATVFDEEIGIWKGDVEKTQVFRLVVRQEDMPRKKLRETLEREVGQLMAALSATEHAQETILYTETVTRMSLAQKVTRLG